MIDVTVNVVIKCADKFLLVQPKGEKALPQRWQNVEGAIAAGESLEAAAERVMSEQLGLRAKTLPRIGMSSGVKSPAQLAVAVYTEFDGQPNDLHISMSDILQNYGWFTLPQAGAVDLRSPGSTAGTYAQLQRATQIF